MLGGDSSKTTHNNSWHRFYICPKASASHCCLNLDGKFAQIKVQNLIQPSQRLQHSRILTLLSSQYLCICETSGVVLLKVFTILKISWNEKSFQVFCHKLPFWQQPLSSLESGQDSLKLPEMFSSTLFSGRNSPFASIVCLLSPNSFLNVFEL